MAARVRVVSHEVSTSIESNFGYCALSVSVYKYLIMFSCKVRVFLFNGKRVIVATIVTMLRLMSQMIFRETFRI